VVWLLGLVFHAGPASAVAEVISLAGPWNFALDPGNEGIVKKWFRRELPERVRLPGTTDENHKGIANQDRRETDHLSRPWTYLGAAWYQRDATVPASWEGKRITLFLERTKHAAVWLDGQPLGAQDSLVGAQVYDLGGGATPGRHRLSILVDNSKHAAIGDSHQLSENTQTNWNGIIGRIELRASDRVWIEDAQVYPDVERRKAKVRVALGSAAGQAAIGSVTVTAASWNCPGEHRAGPAAAPFRLDGPAGTVEIVLDMGPEAVLWDEFSPALYTLTVCLQGTAGGKTFGQCREVGFGMRRFAAHGSQFSINGRTVFLRGKADCCVFPLTGYPPTDVAGWLRVFKIAKSWGINHYRFHSWCPPEAAFAAADMTGVYLQPELPNWGWFTNKPHEEFLAREEDQILKCFGNHPSLVMMSLGNEQGYNRPRMAAIVHRLHQKDPRHLYAQGSNNFFWDPRLAEGDDYWTTMRTRPEAEGAVRGTFSHADLPLGHLQVQPPSLASDYRKAIAGVPVPVVAHEVGLYQVFPDFRQIEKYTGVTRAWNLEIFRERLRAKEMLDQNERFAKASGALAAICYRAEIETALRTPGLAGFQLLDLQDFPGQGTALVGMLDALLDSKGLIEPRQWREFCSETVPLLRTAKYVWTTEETFSAGVEVAHYGPAAMRRAVAAWSLIDARGNVLASGRLPAADIPQGMTVSLGQIRVALAKAAAPQKLTLAVGLEATEYHNHYDFWVYPAQVDIAPPGGVAVCRTLDARTRQLLAAGRNVLLLPDPQRLKNSIEGFFTPDFWCYPTHRRQCQQEGKPPAPGTLGILCEPKHPALAEFPTEFHANWQWWPIVMHSRAVILDDTPADFRPLVQVIDNVDRNHKLGLVLEAKVGAGRLLVCTADLLGQSAEPAPRQLLRSLLDYASSDRFRPAGELSEVQLQTILAQK
jgi:hypothetical protein